MKREKILTDEKGKKVKLTKITDVEGREFNYLEEMPEEEKDAYGDGGSARFGTKRDENSPWGGW